MALLRQGLSKYSQTRMPGLVKHALRKQAPVILFGLSLVFWAFAYGYAVAKFGWFPYKIIRYAEKGALATRDILTGKLPPHLRHTNRTETVIIHRPHTFAEGLTLVSGLTKEGNIAVKVITRDGQIVHRWYIDWFDGSWPNPQHLSQKPQSRWEVMIHGITLLQNGDLVFNLDKIGLVRMTLCGKVVWRLSHPTHHALDIDEKENIWVLGQRITQGSPALPNHRHPVMEDTVLQVTPAGEILREISIFDLLIKNGLQGLLYMSNIKGLSPRVSDDTLHANDVEVFPSHLQAGVFTSGDILLSLRNINTIFVFNLDTFKIKYLSTGKVVRQHDPDFISGDSLSVFDNNNVAPESEGPQSRIVVLSATNDQVQVTYSGSDKQPFYTEFMGKHQRLLNGNILITESTKGRAFEIEPDGKLVWEYINLVDKGLVATIDEAQRLPSFFTRSFFEEGRRMCGQT